MKKIIKPKQEEIAIYHSDFSGNLIGDLLPPIEINIDFNYGSKYDGCKLELHLDDNDFDEILTFLKTKLSKDFKDSYEQFK